MTAPEQLTIFAAFLQVMLTLVAIVRMGRARVASVQAREVNIAEIALSDASYAPRIQKLQNNVRNQFETPVLLYAVIAIALPAGAVSWAFACLALLFAAMRIGHHIIHTGSNLLRHRFWIYTASLGVLALMWILLLVSIIG